ncbi:hypothetical protein, partial [Streptomyces capoamus]|uniref:hypothetical protein n=1 Tax=Streptomyces capoamus TaxID=68183 RepID=UPI001E5480EF
MSERMRCVGTGVGPAGHARAGPVGRAVEAFRAPWVINRTLCGGVPSRTGRGGGNRRRLSG